MIRLPKPAGPWPSVLLLVCALAAARSNAAPVPFVHDAAPRTARAKSPFATAPRAFSSLAEGAGDGTAPSPAPNASDGTWQEFNLLQVGYSLAVYDETNDQLLSVVGTPRLENWALPLKGPRAWQPLPVAPEQIDLYVSTLDPSTGLIYYLTEPGPEVHTLDPLTGAVAVIPGSQVPVAPIGGGMAFDPVNRRLVMLGSEYPFGALQVWALDLLPTPTWSQWLPTGMPPPGEFFFSLPRAVVDPIRRRIVYPIAMTSNEVNRPLAMWTLTLDGAPQWLHFETNLLPDTTFSSRNMVVYDALGDRLVTVGGQGDLYALSLTTFQWSAAPSRNPGPAPRVSAGVAIDQARHRLFVNGGSTSFPGSDTYSDAWALSLDHAPVWSKLVTDATRAPIRGGASDGYDVSRRRLVVFGGSNELGRFRNDTWLVDLRKDPAWSPLATQGTPPPPRYWHVSAWDPVRDQLVVFGGYQGDTYHPLGDLWTLSFGQGTPTWTQVVPAGPAPPGRMLTQFVYDSARDRFLLIDGFGGHSLLDDVWELRLAPSPAWRRLAPAGASPGARAAHMCVYDAARDRVLLVDGSTNDDFFSDLWALEFGSGDGQWWQLQIPPGPSARNLGLLRLETTRDRLLLFGGYGVSRVEPNVIYIDYLNDTWALDLTGGPAWRQLSPAGFLPWGRDRANGAYDAARDRLVLAGGSVDGANDLWALAFQTAPAASRPQQPGAGTAQAQISSALAMSAKTAGGRVTFAVQLPSGDPATLSLFDIAGRNVWSTPVGQLGAGLHAVEMSGATLQPAIYFARLSQGRATRYARIAVVP